MKKVYIVHPFGGKRSNMQAITAICRNLTKLGIMPISPVHAFGFFNDKVPEERNKAMEMREEMVEMCGALFLCGDWRKSEGCHIEMNVALLELIPIYEVAGWRGDKPVFKCDAPSWLKESGGK